MKASRSTVTLALVGFALLSLPPAAGAAAPDSPAGLRPMEPIRCMVDEDIEIHGRYISAEGNGIETHGNCDVEVYNSYIAAGAVGVLANGNSDVELYDTYVEGGSAALLSQGNSDIAMQGSRIVGGTAVRGNGGIDDEGGNEVSGRAAVGAGAPAGVVSIPGVVSVGPDGVRVGSGSDTVVVEEGRVKVESGGQVVEVSGDWRGVGTVYTVDDTDRLLVELGATMKGGRLQMQMAGDVLFDFNSTAIRPDAAAELAKVAHVVRQRSQGVVSVVGHTDSVGDPDYNIRLSEQRALAVQRWLGEQEGIPLSVMRAEGMGEAKPIDYNTMPDGSDNPAGRARNRRVELSFASPEPTVAVAQVKAPGRATAVRLASVERGALPDSCARICRAWPRLGEIQQACVTATLELDGYSVVGNLSCIDVTSTGECVACWRAIGATNGECRKLEANCLGG